MRAKTSHSEANTMHYNALSATIPDWRETSI